MPDCCRATPAGAARPPELLVCWSCHLASVQVQLPEYTARAAGLRPDGFDGGRQLRRGELGGTPAAQPPEYNPFLLHVAVHGLQRVNAEVPSPQFFSSMAEISPTTSLFTCGSTRDVRQSLLFIISSEAHIAFGRDIR